ncbi:exported hypothetical protein [Syntrophobacter sp. SbD1]|nr:exported hypothetical protein [Syntrophobacter sp. SbD1]
MNNRSRFLATSLIVVLSLGVFAIGGYLQAAESDQGIQKGKQAIMEGAKQIMDGNKMAMDIMAKKGMKDAELTAAEKKMAEGYNTIIKGESMMTGSTMAEGKEMVKHGSKMMLDAQAATSAAIEKKGMTVECSAALDTCALGEKKVKEGNLEWYFGY